MSSLVGCMESPSAGAAVQLPPQLLPAARQHPSPTADLRPRLPSPPRPRLSRRRGRGCRGCRGRGRAAGGPPRAGLEVLRDQHPHRLFPGGNPAEAEPGRPVAAGLLARPLFHPFAGNDVGLEHVFDVGVAAVRRPAVLGGGAGGGRRPLAARRRPPFPRRTAMFPAALVRLSVGPLGRPAPPLLGSRVRSKSRPAVGGRRAGRRPAANSSAAAGPRESRPSDSRPGRRRRRRAAALLRRLGRRRRSA